MKLRELAARFLKREVEMRTWTRRKEDGTAEEVTGPREIYRFVNTLEEADGVQFLCPLCYEKNGGSVGTHLVLCWFSGRVPEETKPGPGRWNPAGTGLDDLTFVPPGAVSVQLLGEGCGWHGHVANGEAN